ncbi:pyrroline-5-carboxylate reductase [Bifidobacterium pseudolongum subsp. globosum]|uniref:pyrroline-5-carboxylate reductase n=1 Tax=Bifidobacterium pseudolongum TaxID=1694 RepID=UPI00101EE44D|nr:pyrroline-5-carboxylate reductase [Bifidobacterium pseudolongum]RYQ42509.1 pyrroline-5-carboxylate reductase [Bifidobacterium pseudolongum subsp. globosum]
MTDSTTIGFIGFGNMGQAIARGLIESGTVGADQIVACAAHYDRLVATTKAIGARAVHDPIEVAAAADVIIVAIKPYQVEAVMKPVVQTLVNESKFVVSIAAGWTLEKFQRMLGEMSELIHVQCTIPNTPMAVGKGVLVTEDVDTLTAEQRNRFEALFGSIALIERVDTAHMGIAMCIAGCAPAFTEMYMEALGDAGVKYGLQRATAYRLAAKMIEGVGALYMSEGEHPGAMKDAVCSPGGTTIKGVASLEESAFRGAVIKAVDAIEQR